MTDSDEGHIIAERNEVKLFIDALKWRLSSSDFDPEWDLVVTRNKENDHDQFTNSSTLTNLEFNNYKVTNVLKNLEVKEYSHSVRDCVNSKPPFLHVFGKVINNRLVYIKLKMKEHPNRKVICVSFHFARKELLYPYTE